ncbi:MAG: hypothetical protein QNJ00_06535 [Woeseiaceae bacterium]|nr:hypothetical protein [Woeseiaceae bacterium]
MAASQSVMADTPETIVREMAQHMETCAAAGDWSEVENIAIRLRSAVMNVPESERRALLLLLQQSTENVTALAEAARRDVTGRMSAIRRGQAAQKAYEAR